MKDDRFRIGKVKISKTNPEDVRQRLIDAALNGVGGYVCVTNLRMVMYAEKNPDYATLMDESFMNLPDGVPLTWCGKAWGLKNIDVTRGPDTFTGMLTDGDKRLKHFLLGDTEEVLQALKEKFNGVNETNIVGTYSPPFIDVKDFDYEGIADMIRKSGANIVWTAMRAPKQDEFGRELKKYLPNILSIGVGRAFRLAIGEVQQAPGWANKMGVGGFFMRRQKWYKVVWLYISNSLIPVKYILQIKYWKLSGKKYYE